MGGPSARMSKHSGSRLWSEGPSYGSLDRLRVRSVWEGKVSMGGQRQGFVCTLGAGGAGRHRRTAAWSGLGWGQYGLPKCKGFEAFWEQAVRGGTVLRQLGKAQGGGTMGGPSAKIFEHSGGRRCKDGPSYDSLQRLRAASG